MFGKFNRQFDEITAKHGATTSTIFAIIKNKIDYHRREVYLHTAPPKKSNPHYRKGESLAEKTDLNPQTIRTHLKAICVTYPSKKAFDEAEDKFQGKLMARVYNRVTHLMWYFENPEYLEKSSETTEKQDSRAPKQDNPLKDSNATDIYPKCEILSLPKAKIYCSNMYTKKPSDNTSSHEGVVSKLEKTVQSQLDMHAGEIKNKEVGKTAANRQVAEQMARIWEEIVEDGGATICLTGKRIAFLIQAYRDAFKKSLEEWRNYCKTIRSREYLMRSKGGFFNLEWALRFPNIKKILAGKYVRCWMKPAPVPDVVNSNFQERLKEQNDQSIAEETSPPVKQFKQELRKRLGEGRYEYLVKSCSLELEEGGGIMLRTSFEHGHRLSLPCEEERAFRGVVDDLRIPSFKVIGPSDYDASHRFYDPERVHFEYPKRKQTQEEINQVASLLDEVRKPPEPAPILIEKPIQTETRAPKSIDDVIGSLARSLRSPAIRPVPC